MPQGRQGRSERRYPRSQPQQLRRGRPQRALLLSLLPSRPAGADSDRSTSRSRSQFGDAGPSPQQGSCVAVLVPSSELLAPLVRPPWVPRQALGAPPHAAAGSFVIVAPPTAPNILHPTSGTDRLNVDPRCAWRRERPDDCLSGPLRIAVD